MKIHVDQLSIVMHKTTCKLQGIAHFMGRASSSQNSYSQCSLMLRTWRGLTPADEILPRLCDALQRIRRHDLAVKVGLELAVPSGLTVQMFTANIRLR